MSDVDVLAALQEDDYRLGDLQAVRYDKSRTDIFPDDYIGHLYHRCRESKRRSGNGILDALFGGNPASDFSSIVSYLAQRPFLLILGRWEGEKFHEMGFAFPTISVGTNGTEKALLCGYGFFASSWGSEDQEIVTMLGLAYIFKEFDLVAIHGNRFKENVLTSKFMEKFGFKTVGDVPRFQLKGTKLVPMVVSTLLREDFEKYVADFLLKQYREAAVETPAPAVAEAAPVAVETREEVDAQVAALAAGEIVSVFFPYSSTYVPGIPEGMDLKVIPQGETGAGIYFFNPRKISAEEVCWRELVLPVAPPEPKAAPEPAPAEELVVVQATDPEDDDVVLAEKLVPRTAEDVAVQIEAFKRQFPGCHCEVRA